MIVIHPKDRTTVFLAALYEGVANTTVITDNSSRKELNRLFHRTTHERIMLLGHGCKEGLLWRQDDNGEEFDAVVVGHPHGYHLRHHRALVAVFCHADEFFEAEGLHGFCTGMFISEMQEAKACGVATTAEEIEVENKKFGERMHMLLSAGVPLSQLPRRLQELDDAHSPLTTYNYSRLYYK